MPIRSQRPGISRALYINVIRCERTVMVSGILLRSAKRIEAWSYERRVKRSRRVLESLPEHILHDIGWPNVDDRLPGIAKNTAEFKRGQ